MDMNSFKFTSQHEWAKKIGGNKVSVGITKYAAEQLGDIVFVDVPKIGTAVEKDKTMGVVESVKTVSDINSPVSGKITARNNALEGDPALANQDPMGEGWIVEIEMSRPEEYDDLMNSSEYQEHCAHCEH